jgi:hypothetical protein
MSTLAAAAPLTMHPDLAGRHALARMPRTGGGRLAVAANAECRQREARVSTKKRCTFMIEREMLDQMRSITNRTGVPMSEQVRQGIRWWLESRQWPHRKQQSGGSGTVVGDSPRARVRPRGVANRR